MKAHDLIIFPRDPILVRDGRPFSSEAGAEASSLPWPLPATVAGALRTHYGQLARVDWYGNGSQQVLEGVHVAGPLLAARYTDTSSWVVHFSIPADALLLKVDKDQQIVRLSPLKEFKVGSGCDLPFGLLPLSTNVKGKPAQGDAYWSLSATAGWLCGATPERISDALAILPRESRTNVQVDPATFSSKEGMLFSVSYLVMNDVPREGNPAIAMLARVTGDLLPATATSAIVPFGGERRSAYLQPVSAWPAMPEAVKSCAQTVREIGRIRLQLATPALFTNGWYPGWLQEQAGFLQGELPNAPGVTLRLVSAAVNTRQAVSGWNMKRNANGKEAGPKAARYLAPAGSVYFFEIISGSMDNECWQRLWLQSISDLPADQQCGYGLAMPGTWQNANNNEVN